MKNAAKLVEEKGALAGEWMPYTCTHYSMNNPVAPTESFEEATISWNAFHPVSMALEVSNVNQWVRGYANKQLFVDP